jgi:hypothetical protein
MDSSVSLLTASFHLAKPPLDGGLVFFVEFRFRNALDGRARGFDLATPQPKQVRLREFGASKSNQVIIWDR